MQHLYLMPSSPSANSVSLASKVSSSVALSSADRGAGEGEGRWGGKDGEAEWGSWGREGEGDRFSSPSLCRFSVLFLLLLNALACWFLRGLLSCFKLFSLVGSFWRLISDWLSGWWKRNIKPTIHVWYWNTLPDTSLYHNVALKTKKN